MDLLSRVRRTVKRYAMLNPGETVIVGVSGGPDSTALLHLLWRLREEFTLTLHVAHLNHQLRGAAAAADAEAVAALAQEWGLPVTVVEVDVQARADATGLSLEEAGREARYAFFQHLAAQIGATRIALGHQADDQAETILMRLLRGTGPHGLGGIPPVRPATPATIIRPLIDIERHAILAYCRTHSLPLREDASNAEPIFLRNRIRLELLPYLTQTFNPRLREDLCQLGEIQRTEDAFLEEITCQNLAEWEGLLQSTPEELRLPVAPLLAVPLALERRLLRALLRRWRPDLRGLGFHHLEAIRQAARQEGAVGFFPGGSCRRKGEYLCFTTARRPPAPSRFPPLHYRLPCPGEAFIPEWGLALTLTLGPAAANTNVFADLPPHEAVDLFDPTALSLPLELRNRRPGDRFRPRGVGGTQKLKDWCNSAHIPPAARDRLPLLVDQEGILWVIGHRRAERAQVTPATNMVLVVRARFLERSS